MPFPKEDTALKHNFTAEEKMIIDYRRRSAVIGEAETVAEKLRALVKQYAIHELTIVTITSNFEDRKKSYKLLKESLI